jgi:hypothetical protein
MVTTRSGRQSRPPPQAEFALALINQKPQKPANSLSVKLAAAVLAIVAVATGITVSAPRGMNFTQLLQRIGAQETVQAQVIEAGTQGYAAYVQKMYTRVVQVANKFNTLTPQEKREVVEAFTGIQFWESPFKVSNEKRLAASLGDRITAETQNRMGKLAGYIPSNQTPIIAILLMVAAYAVIRFALTRRRIPRATPNGHLQVALQGNRTGVNRAGGNRTGVNNIEVIHRVGVNSRTLNANNNAQSIAKSNTSNSSNSGSNNNARSILNSNGNECQRITSIFEQASQRTFPSTHALVNGVWRAMKKIVSETSLYEKVALPVAELSLALTKNYIHESNGDVYVNHLIEMFKECIEMQKDLQKLLISGNQQTTRAINGSNSGNMLVTIMSSRNCTREQVLDALRAILLYVKKLGNVLMYRALDVKSWHKPQTLTRLHASMDAFIDYSKNTNGSTRVLKGMVQRLFDTYGKIHNLYSSSDGRSHKYDQDILKGLPNEINAIMTMLTGVNWTKNKSKEARYRLGVARSRLDVTWMHTRKGWERFMNRDFVNATNTRPSTKMTLVHKYMSSNLEPNMWQQFKAAWNSLKSNRRVRGSNKLNNIELGQYSPQEASRIVQIQRLLFTPIRMMTIEGLIVLLTRVVPILSAWATGHPILCGVVAFFCASLQYLSNSGHQKYKMEKKRYFKLLHTLVQDAESSGDTRIMTANNEIDFKKAINNVGSLASMQGRYIFWVSPAQQMPLIQQIHRSAERVHNDARAKINGVLQYIGR